MMASRAADELDERIRHVVALARTVEGSRPSGTARMRIVTRLLEALATPDQRLNAVLFATVDLEQHGARTSTARAGPAWPSVSTPARPWRPRDKRTAQPLLALTNGDPVLPIPMPVHDVRAPTRRGLGIVGLKTGQMANVLASIPLPSGSTAALVDLREGRVLVDSTAVDLLPQATLPTDQLSGSEQAGTSFARSRPAAAEYLHAFQQLSGAPWAVVINVPIAAVLDPIYSVAGKMALAHVAIALAHRPRAGHALATDHAPAPWTRPGGRPLITRRPRAPDAA